MINGNTYEQWVTGGILEAVIKNTQVGRFDPSRNPAFARIDASVANFVTFTFVAAAPGETEIDFNIKTTGEEGRGISIQRGSGNAVATAFFTTIEVTDCYDAYTSGLATVFTEKDMGRLTEFFLLAGNTPNANVRTLTQFFVFIPNPQNRAVGSYAFVDLYWSTSAPGSRCTAYVSGHYDVVFYGPDPANPVEGDLLMKGTGVSVCPGRTTPIDYTQNAGFQIGFKPRPTLPPGP